MAFENTEGVGVLGYIIKLIDEHGLFKIFQGLFVLGAFLYIMYNVSNFPEMVRGAFKHETIQRQEAHDAAIEERRKIKPEIDLILKNTLASLDADRVFIMEMHNGTNNTAGLPFIYGEMTYEEVNDGIAHIDEDYVSINLSRFNFPMFIERKHMWSGTIEQLRDIDDKLATRMKSNDATYFAVISIHGKNTSLGFFGITYCHGKPPASSERIISKLSTESQALAILLDTKVNKVK